MSQDQNMKSDRIPEHCCSCWKYTDDETFKSSETVQLIVAATSMVVNATPSMEQSDAYKAADAFLAARFKAGTPMLAPRF